MAFAVRYELHSVPYILFVIAIIDDSEIERAHPCKRVPFDTLDMCRCLPRVRDPSSVSCSPPSYEGGLPHLIDHIQFVIFVPSYSTTPCYHYLISLNLTDGREKNLYIYAKHVMISQPGD